MPNFDSPRGLTRAFRLTPSLIAREIRAARAATARITLTDKGCAGLRLIIGARSATWSVTARPRGLDADGKRRPLKSVAIGDATEIDPEAARKAAIAIKREIALGRDPVAERREHHRQQALAARLATVKANADAGMLRRILAPQSPLAGSSAVTILDFAILADAMLKDAAEAFVLHGAGGGRLHVYQTAGNLRLALSEMGVADLKPGELGKHHVRALVELHAKAGRRATARHRHSAIDRLYKWLLAVDAVEDNPASRVQVPPPPPPRTNVPAAATVKSLWDAAAGLPAPRAAFVRLALLLPLRRQELANLKIKNVVRDNNELEIRLAPTQTKNRKSFTMPLTGTAAAIVTELLDRGGAPEDTLIPLTKSCVAFSDWTHLGKQIERGTGLHIRWHDARRLFASEMAEHGIANFGTIDGLLNHARSASLGGVARSYHHAAEKAVRLAAMVAWDRILLHAARHGQWPRQMGTAPNVVALAKVVAP